MSKYQGGMIGSVANATSGTAYTGRANGVFPLPQQIITNTLSLWSKAIRKPNPPTIGGVSPVAGTSNAQMTVNFIPPVQNGGSNILNYTVTSSGGQTSTGTGSPIVISGVDFNQTFTVSATNISGTSLQSEVGTPAGVVLVGNVYDITSKGAVTSITDLEEFSPLLPAEGFIKYTILRSGAAGSNKTIVTKFKKNGTQLCQSAFMLGGASNFTISAVTSILFYGNDDHDTLLMQGDGTGVIARQNNSFFDGNQSIYNAYDRFRGTTELYISSPADTVFQYSPSSLFNAASGAGAGVFSLNLISFPKTNTNVWIDNTRQKYKVNDFPEQQLPAEYVAAIGPSSPTNSLFTISDGVNCFMVKRHTSTDAAVYVEINLNDGTFYKYNTYTLTVYDQSNNTEEDAEGNQLFAVDASSSFLKDSVFYWGSTGWRWDTSPTSSTNRNATTSLGLSTQSGMDIFGSIDANDGFVWFADWGHDNGGLFDVGQDTQLGVAKTSIKLIDN